MIIPPFIGLPAEVWVEVGAYSRANFRSMRLACQYFKLIADYNLDSFKKNIPKKRKVYEGQKDHLTTAISRDRFLSVTRHNFRIFRRDDYSYVDIAKPIHISGLSKVAVINEEHVWYYPKGAMSGMRIDFTPLNQDRFLPFTVYSPHVVYSPEDGSGNIAAYINRSVLIFDKNANITHQFQSPFRGRCRSIYLIQTIALVIMDDLYMGHIPGDPHQVKLPSFKDSLLIDNYLFINLTQAPYGVNVYNTTNLQQLVNIPIDSVYIKKWKDIYLEGSSQGTLNLFQLNPYELIGTLGDPVPNQPITHFEIWNDLVAAAYPFHIAVWDISSQIILAKYSIQSPVINLKFDRSDIIAILENGSTLVISSNLSDSTTSSLIE